MKTYEMQVLWKKILKFIGITGAVYLGIRFILPLVIPFFIAYWIATGLNKIVKRVIKKTKKHRKLVVTIVYFLFVLLLVAIGGLICYQIFLQGKEVCIHGKTYLERWEGYWGFCCDRAERILGQKENGIGASLWDRFEDMLGQGKTKIITCVVNCSMCGIKGALKASWVLLVILISTLLILQDYDKLRLYLQKMTIGKLTGNLLKNIRKAGGSYLKAQCIIWLCVSAICVTGLFLTGNSCALLAGIGIGFCDALPFLGTGTVFIPWIIVKVIQGKYGLATLYFAIYVSCSILRELLEPKLVGNSVGASPVFVIMSIYIGIKVYGGVGVFFGPLSALLIWEIYKLTEKENEMDMDTEEAE